MVFPIMPSEWSLPLPNSLSSLDRPLPDIDPEEALSFLAEDLEEEALPCIAVLAGFAETGALWVDTYYKTIGHGFGELPRSLEYSLDECLDWAKDAIERHKLVVALFGVADEDGEIDPLERWSWALQPRLRRAGIAAMSTESRTEEENAELLTRAACIPIREAVNSSPVLLAILEEVRAEISSPRFGEAMDGIIRIVMMTPIPEGQDAAEVWGKVFDTMAQSGALGFVEGVFGEATRGLSSEELDALRSDVAFRFRVVIEQRATQSEPTILERAVPLVPELGNELAPELEPFVLRRVQVGQREQFVDDSTVACKGYKSTDKPFAAETMMFPDSPEFPGERVTLPDGSTIRELGKKHFRK